MNRMIVSLLVAVMVIGLILSGCSTTSSTTTSSTTTSSTNDVVQEEFKTLKVGVVYWSGNDRGRDALQMLEVMVDSINADDGISVGSDSYKIQLVPYDTNNEQPTEVAIVNRLVYQDEVKFIITCGDYIDAWISATEDNKVIVFQELATMGSVFDPKYHYVFNPCTGNPQLVVATGWYAEKYPDKAKNLLMIAPDSQLGQMITGMMTHIWQVYGIEAQVLHFPASAVDLSSIGTKVVQMNPSTVFASCGNGIQDGLVCNAVRSAGYEGQLFSPPKMTLETLLPYMSEETLEGFITGAFASEFDECPDPAAQKYKELWISQYGTWTNPACQGAAGFNCLMAAIQKAGTLDTDILANVIGSGLEFDSVIGKTRMISRPDLGNDRTVDSICVNYMKQIQDGKPVLLDTIGIDKAIELFRIAYPPATPEP